jgi:hypothetical protein
MLFSALQKFYYSIQWTTGMLQSFIQLQFILLQQRILLLNNTLLQNLKKIGK